MSTGAVSFNGLMRLAKTAKPKRQFRRTFIRQWRKYRKLTLEQLAEKVEMTASHFSMMERGQRGYTQETLENLAEALGTTVGSLLDRNPLIEGDDSLFWDRAEPRERKMVIDILKTVQKSN